MIKAKRILSAFMSLAMAFTASAPASAAKVNYKNDVPEYYYSSLLEITNGSDDEKYYNRIASAKRYGSLEITALFCSIPI